MNIFMFVVICGLVGYIIISLKQLRKEMSQPDSYDMSQKIHQLEEINQKLTQNNHQLKKKLQTSTNIGEQLTAQHLDEIFQKFKSEKIIDTYYIYNNILVEHNDEIRQIDHLVISSGGIFIIETKHWKSDIYFNFNKYNLANYKLDGLEKYLFSHSNNDFITFNLYKDKNDNLIFKNYGHPLNQITETMKVARSALNVDFINLIIYFNHAGEGKLHIGTNRQHINIAQNKTEFEAYFTHKIAEQNSHCKISDAKIDHIIKKLPHSSKLC